MCSAAKCAAKVFPWNFIGVSLEPNWNNLKKVFMCFSVKIYEISTQTASPSIALAWITHKRSNTLSITVVGMLGNYMCRISIGEHSFSWKYNDSCKCWVFPHLHTFHCL